MTASVVTQKYELVPVANLQQHPENPRRGNADTIGNSISANGFYGAVVAQRSTGRVLAGNHRLASAEAAGIKKLPVIWVDVDDDHARRILLADNRTSDLATNDEAALLALLEDVALMPEALAGAGYDADALEDLRAAVGRIPVAAPPADTDAQYAETPEDEEARLAGRSTSNIHSEGLRELIVVYPLDEHAELVRIIGSLRETAGPETTTSDVVARSLRYAAGDPAAAFA